MGLDTELEFQKYRRIDQSPRNIHRSRCYISKDDDRDVKGKHTSSGFQSTVIDQAYTQISFNESKNSFCESKPDRPAGLAGNEELKRGSIYQSSKEVRKMKKMGKSEGKKIELLCSSDTSLSFQIVDSLSESNDSSFYQQQKRSSSMSTMINLGGTLANKTYIGPNSSESLDQSYVLFPSVGNVAARNAPSDNFFEICLDTKDRRRHSSEIIDKGMVGKPNYRCERSAGPLKGSHCFSEGDKVLALHKSSSEKVGMSHSPPWSDSHHSKGSPKVRFNPIRRMLDPIMKSKSQRSQPVSVTEFGDMKTLGLTSITRKKTVCKSLLRDFSNSVHKEEPGAHFVQNDQNRLDVASSPAHLHGLLKLDYKHGVPFLVFSLNNLEDTLVAKTWKGHNAFNWVYTFHSLNDRRKTGTSGWGSKERHKEASMVGQMQVSCYLCSKKQSAGDFDNSMVTEFVLYDIAHARKSSATEGSPDCKMDSIKPPKGPSTGDSDKNFSMDLNDVSDSWKLKHQARDASCNYHSDVPTSYPWAPADLHPYLQIAAVVIQVPFQKRESFKEKQGDCGKAYSNLVDFSVIEQRSDNTPHNTSPTKVKVVTSTGTHGLPSTEDGSGPSSLLDRWRLGGGCNCGGWDMCCPLVVFGNPDIQNTGDHHVGSRQPLELFVQGGKEKMPALTINLIDEGQYLVDFHAQLSTLQAFSICVAILHSTADCTSAEQERTTHKLQCNSLKLLLEEEVKFLIEAVAEEEKRKTTKITEETPPSFLINPPFSPIARV